MAFQKTGGGVAARANRDKLLHDNDSRSKKMQAKKMQPKQ